MDNFKIDVTSEGLPNLERALAIAMGGHKKVYGFNVNAKKGLILYWLETKDATPFIAPIKDPIEVAAQVMNWLLQQDYGTQPDHDGDNGKGWRLYCEDWGQVGSDSRAFVAIQPSWAMYGK